MAATRFQTWLAELPQGPFKMVFACIAGLLVILAVILAPLTEALLCMARGRWFPQVPVATACTHLEIPEGALWAIFAFLAGVAGFSSFDFKTKRETFVPSPPGTVDVDDAKAGAGKGTAAQATGPDGDRRAPAASYEPARMVPAGPATVYIGDPQAAPAVPERLDYGGYGPDTTGPVILPDNQP